MISREPVDTSDSSSRGDPVEIARELALLARWMDSLFVVPRANIRFGLDALLGLLPGLGDTATSIVSLYILNSASRFGASRATLARMAANIALDYMLGAIPIAGDLFDVAWKSNERNVALLRRHLQATPAEERKLRRGDRLFVTALIGGLVAILVCSVLVAWWTLAWVASLFWRLAG